ncbi:MAG: hypothetical protein ABIP64_16425 [Burkholderiales bacterium]
MKSILISAAVACSRSRLTHTGRPFASARGTWLDQRDLSVAVVQWDKRLPNIPAWRWTRQKKLSVNFHAGDLAHRGVREITFILRWTLWNFFKFNALFQQRKFDFVVVWADG